jgi:hypothetical protein
MATLSRLTVGQVLYSVERVKMGNTSMRRGALYRVRITEICEDSVMASWNGNPPRRYGLRAIKKWRVNEPRPIGTTCGMPHYR